MKPITIDFDERAAVDEWMTVDDPVMGGRSRSAVRWADEPWPDGERRGVLCWEGTVSLENNGGFCSMRQSDADRGQPGVDRLVVLLRGDGRRYKWTLRTRRTPRSSSWRHSFATEPGQWQELTLPLRGFELWRRGRRLDADGAPDPAGITALGLLISDKQEGDFRLDVARISFQ